MNKITRTIALLVVAMLSLALGIVNAQDAKVLVTGLSMVGGDIETIDPGKAEASSQIEVINQIFIGLTSQSVTTGETQLGIAESMEMSEDGLTFTFALRQDVSWVRYNAESGAVEQILGEDGNPLMVTAQHVYDGMVRSLNAENASPYSYVLAPYVVNGVEFNAGEAAVEDLGIVVVDDYTLSITQPSAAAFAPAIYGLWMSRPVLLSAIEEGGDSWTEPEYIATNGPFALKEWAHGESLTLIKNPFWTGTDAIPAPALDEVVFRFLDAPQQLVEFEAGNLDAIDVPAAELERVKADSVLSTELVTGTNPCTYYIGFDNTEAPTDNVHLRRALSYAIDRAAIVTNVTKGGQIPAQWFSRPGLNASPSPETHPDLGIKFDAAKAQEELALALADLGLADVSELPALPFWYNDTALHASVAQAIQQMWAETLGITVQLAPQESTSYFSSLSEDAPNIYRAGWCQDYSDANNFLYDVFFSQSSQNDTGFVSEAFDALVAQARTETDLATRVDLYAQAETVLVVDNAAIAPIYFYTKNQLVKSNVESALSVTGNEAYYLWNKN